MTPSQEAMGRLPLFAQLTPAELGLIVKHLRVQRLTALSTLFNEGDVARGCFVVLGGDVEVFKTIDERRQEKVATLAPGALAGHLALVDGKPRSATCRAGVGGARLLELGRDDFDLLLRARSSFAFKILDHIALDLVARLRTADESICQALEAKTPAQRKVSTQAATVSLFGFEVPGSIHGVNLDAIEVEATSQVRQKHKP